MFKVLILISALVVLACAKNVNVQKAVVKLVPVIGANAVGSITFEQTSDGVKVSGSFDKLPASSNHGLIIHAVGDVSGDACASVGDHFNPHKKSHGGRTDSKSTRHVGDLGNVKAEADGKATVTFTDKVISLNGEDHIVGKAVVIHANEDDLGKGTDDESKKSGNVGAPLACGIVGITAEKSSGSAVVPTIVTFVVALVFKLIICRHSAVQRRKARKYKPCIKIAAECADEDLCVTGS